MRKFGALLARKTAVPDNAIESAPAGAGPSDNPLELDEELFSNIGAQIGGENEALRNLLLTASAKIDELDTIKAAVGQLVDPVSRTLREIEAEKSEKLALQAVLNNTRTAYGKLRNETAETEKKLAAAQRRCDELQEDLANTQDLLRSAEATKSEAAVDLAARRAQVAELQSLLTQEIAETKMLREENRSLDERFTAADKRIVALEADINAARQRLLMAEDEKRAQQDLLDKTAAETSQLTRKLTETESGLSAAQGRLRHVEANCAELTADRDRLATALEEANERHANDRSNQRTRFEALQARAGVTEKLLAEARDHLIARAEEIRGYERRLNEALLDRDNLQTRVADLEADRIERESVLQELDQSRASLMERGQALARAFASKEAALDRAEETIAALKAHLDTLEQTATGAQQSAEQTIEELSAALRREKMERSVVEGALETARKELARVMREVMALQRNKDAGEPDAAPPAANAA
jgi:crescentin